MIDVLITGALGVMGGYVRAAIEQTDDIRIVAGVDLTASDALPYPVYASLDDVKESPQVVLDFSHFSALTSVLNYCISHKTAVVICTTGHSMEQRAEIAAAAKEIPVFFSANMSLGVNLIKRLSQDAAGVLENAFDIELLEKHHNRKIDAPSGTAVMLAEAINESLLHKKHFVYERQSRHEKRGADELGIHSIRGGSTVGEHSVFFYGEDEVVELTHIAHSRKIFATGAVSALRYISQKNPGLYNMDNLFAEEQSVTEIRTLPHQTVFHLMGRITPDLFTKVFELIAKASISVDLITFSFSGVISHLSFSVDNRFSSAISDLIGDLMEKHALTLDMMADLTRITVKGPGMEFEAGVGARVFSTLNAAGIPPLAVGTSEEKIVLLVPGKLADKAEEVLKKEYA
ncbi:MAG: 4-hydroxy-tetrahydrodipicolinate reductase [Clostridiales bacterium]|nr:4-hydroxy-tetrahydrodipicolinate reductase [Clostridiales bacterium]